MATLKHISSKNSNYTAIEAYLVYQHDEFTGKQLLDEHGKSKLRESYLLDTLECGDFSFATACLLANRKYGKNTQHGDIKSHQYIISFDPRDAADNGLTMEKAQALGLQFCKDNFPGHPAIVCTQRGAHAQHQHERRVVLDDAARYNLQFIHFDLLPEPQARWFVRRQPSLRTPCRSGLRPSPRSCKPSTRG